MNKTVSSILERRKNKTIAVILGTKESVADEYLPEWAQAALRKAVLDAVNDFHSLCLDIYSSLDTGEVTLNEHWLQILEEIHDAVVAEPVYSNGTS